MVLADRGRKTVSRLEESRGRKTVSRLEESRGRRQCADLRRVEEGRQ